jgi:hypothetical protein
VGFVISGQRCSHQDSLCFSVLLHRVNTARSIFPWPACHSIPRLYFLEQQCKLNDTNSAAVVNQRGNLVAWLNAATHQCRAPPHSTWVHTATHNVQCRELSSACRETCLCARLKLAPGYVNEQRMFTYSDSTVRISHQLAYCLHPIRPL